MKKYISLIAFILLITTISNCQSINKNNDEFLPQLKSGHDFILYLDQDKQLFTAGNNEFLQLNHILDQKTELSNITDSIELEVNESIILIDAGYQHAGLLTDFNRVFVWGDNQFGQLGIQSEDKSLSIDITLLLPLEDQEHVIDINFGGFHSGFLTNQNRLFLIGLNQSGQLGNGTFETNSDISIIAFEEKILDFDLGSDHSIVLTESSVYVWGSNFNGQLGIGDRPNQNKPVELDNDDLIEFNQVVAGVGISYLVSDNNLYGFGKTAHGMLGENIDQDLFILTHIHIFDTSIESLSIGYAHLIVKTEDNVYGIGRNSLNQLSSSRTELFTRFYNIPSTKENLRLMAAGGFYQIYLFNNEEFIIRGYSEYVKF